MKIKFLIKKLLPVVPNPIKMAVHRFFERRFRKNVKWLRGASNFVANNFIDEIVLCPNGDVYNKDEAGSEFLVPIHLMESLKVGASTWETIESKLLIANSEGESSIMLDVGANIGLHAIRVAWAKPSAHVYAFEPVTANYEVLCKNILRNRLESRIESIHAAIGAEDGNVSIPSCYGTGNWIGAKDSGEMETVPLLSIDSFISARNIRYVTVVKADAEGYELNILRGAQRCLREFRPKLLLEVDSTWSARFGYHPSELFAFLRSYDYDYVRITNERQVLPATGSLTEDLEAGNNFFFFPTGTPFNIE